jgi:hypothetical protein
MSGTGSPTEPVRPTRAARSARNRRVHRAVVLGVVAALVVAAGGLWFIGRGDGTAASAPDGGSGGRRPRDTRLVALQVEGGPAPLLAIVGVPGEGTPVVVPVPEELTITVPGQGETSMGGVAALPGDTMRVSLSNLTGTWIEHFAVISLRELAAAIESAGGVTVTLPSAYPTEGGVLGPGEIELSGAQARTFLTGGTDDAAVRWEILLSAMLAHPPSLPANGSIETDDAEAVTRTLADARGAEVLDIPTDRVSANVLVPVYPALDELLTEALGTNVPVPAIVQNGSGEPGVGEGVAVRIIPAGFRIVISENAQSFDVLKTDIFALGTAREGEAWSAKAALGVGRVRVTPVPSNVGDITIVVGKDFTA